MDLSELQEKYLPFVIFHFLPLLLSFLGLMFLSYGLISLNSHKQDKQEILIDSASDTASSVKNPILPAKKSEMTIDIEGVVLKQGVNKIAIVSRLKDALIATGGLANNADRMNVVRGLKLAAKLIDGTRIYIPFVRDQGLANSGTHVLGPTDSNGFKDVNTASKGQLDSLPGIDKVRAQKIIDGSLYTSIDELLAKKIVGQKVFDQIKVKETAN